MTSYHLPDLRDVAFWLEEIATSDFPVGCIIVSDNEALGLSDDLTFTQQSLQARMTNIIQYIYNEGFKVTGMVELRGNVVISVEKR